MQTPLEPSALRTRLSVMMFLQYAIWGAWLPLMHQFLSRHRGFNEGEIGYLFMIGGVGAVFAPFIAGQIADRYFNTEKYLAISHILGGILVWQLSWIESYWGFFVFSLLYSLIYSPTLALTNSISFHHLPDRDRDFGKVRVWGTIGWIAVGICIGQWLLRMHTLMGKARRQSWHRRRQALWMRFGSVRCLAFFWGCTASRCPPRRRPRAAAHTQRSTPLLKCDVSRF